MSAISRPLFAARQKGAPFSQKRKSAQEIGGSLFVHKHLNLDKKKDGTKGLCLSASPCKGDVWKFPGEITMGKFAEADAAISNIFICRKCKARNKRGSKKCRKCGSVYMRAKRKDIRVKK
jgi:ribosomal protein L40E